jgi:dihydrofolate reductase
MNKIKKLPPITIIVAVDLEMGIGKNNDLLCYLSSDLKRFKQITTGHTVVMGLNTWNSLPKKPLPNRRHLVLAPEKIFNHHDVIFVNNVEDAISKMDNKNENFIIGGGMVYKTFIEYAQKILLTVFRKKFDADTFFPNISIEEWNLTEESEKMYDEEKEIEYIYQTFVRK